MTDKRREGVLFHKKSNCYFAGELNEGTESYELEAGNGNHQMVNLPPNCLITDAYIFVKTASDAATSATATLGTASGGAQIVSAANIAAAGEQGTFAGMLDTGSGATVWLGITKVGAETAVGKYVIVVEYLEYTKKTGEYTEL
jgi:hypothetical protein